MQQMGYGFGDGLSRKGTPYQYWERYQGGPQYRDWKAGKTGPRLWDKWRRADGKTSYNAWTASGKPVLSRKSKSIGPKNKPKSKATGKKKKGVAKAKKTVAKKKGKNFWDQYFTFASESKEDLKDLLKQRPPKVVKDAINRALRGTAGSRSKSPTVVSNNPRNVDESRLRQAQGTVTEELRSINEPQDDLVNWSDAELRDALMSGTHDVGLKSAVVREQNRRAYRKARNLDDAMNPMVELPPQRPDTLEQFLEREDPVDVSSESYNIVDIKHNEDSAYGLKYEFTLDEPDDPDMSGTYVIRNNQIRRGGRDYSNVFGVSFLISRAAADATDPTVLRNFKQVLRSITDQSVEVEQSTGYDISDGWREPPNFRNSGDWEV